MKCISFQKLNNTVVKESLILLQARYAPQYLLEQFIETVASLGDK
jgi:hypothetical protein